VKQTMLVVRTEALRKSFDKVMAVDGLTFSVKEGEIFGLVGPDGAGKTTSMRILTGVMLPTSGEAIVLGKNVAREPEVIKEEIGYMSQRFGLYLDLTVAENLEFYADIYGVSRRTRLEKMDKLLTFSGLSPFKKRFAGNLSGGMKQKLGLACALIHTPKILFLDEPTNGVDPVSRRDFWRILYQLLKEKVTIVVSTSYLDEAERCNRLGLLHRGKLLACGTPSEIKSLLKGTLLELITGEPRKAAGLLKKEFPQGAVGIFGDRIHLLVRDQEGSTMEIRSLLARNDIELNNLREIQPTLEDVFVSVLDTKTTN